MGIVIGAGTTRFISEDPGGREPVLTVDLPLTPAAGLVETYIERVLEHEVTDGNGNDVELQEWQGAKMYWTFNVAEWVLGETIMLLESIHERCKAGYSTKIYPRYSDQPNRWFTDILSDTKEYSIGVRKGGTSRAKHNRLPVYIFKTKGLVKDKKLVLNSTAAVEYRGRRGDSPIKGNLAT